MVGKVDRLLKLRLIVDVKEDPGVIVDADCPEDETVKSPASTVRVTLVQRHGYPE